MKNYNPNQQRKTAPRSDSIKLLLSRFAPPRRAALPGFHLLNFALFKGHNNEKL